jgi:hypothetical protein
MNRQDFLGRLDLADRYSVSVRTLTNWARTGLLPKPIRMVIDKVPQHFWRLSTLESFERQRFDGQTFPEVSKAFAEREAKESP